MRTSVGASPLTHVPVAWSYRRMGRVPRASSVTTRMSPAISAALAGAGPSPATVQWADRRSRSASTSTAAAACSPAGVTENRPTRTASVPAGIGSAAGSA